jgi:hypothetical protein
MSLSLASPNWPAERSDSGARLWRLVLVSLLAHGLALLIWPGFRPFFPTDGNLSPLRLELRRPAKPAEPAEPLPPSLPRAIAMPGRAIGSKATPAAPTVVEGNHVMAGSTPDPTPSATELLERSRAEISSASRRQMLDPMFAPASQQAAKATPLARATAPARQTVEEIGDNLLRVTTAHGQRYCLQKLPEVATRDIPGQVLSIPMTCP